MMAVAALVAPAAAYTTQWQGDADGNLTIDLIVNCYVQVLWQDQAIVFDSDYDSPHDPWSPNLMGTAYAYTGHPDGKVTATDAWAGHGAPFYFESTDGAWVYVKSNNALSMMVHTNGDLSATDPDCGDCTIPTWFTMAMSGPFVVEGVDIGMGTIPGDGNGVYLAPDAVAGELSYTDATHGVHPNQWAFECEPASQEWHLGPLCPYVEGNIKFLARILRSGMADPGGDYSTFLDLHFASPDF
jgi:hypothetical protein